MRTAVPLREAIARIKPRKFVRLEQVPPCGTLELRKSGQGVLSFYWRVTFASKSKRYQIGLYDASAPPRSSERMSTGYSLNAARAEAAKMAVKHYAALADGGYESVVASQKAKAESERKAKGAAGYTLEKLFGLYVKVLEARNKDTAKDARNLFSKNVRIAFPEIANMQASKVTSEQMATVLRKISSTGKNNTARKLKAYLRSAFETAKNVGNSAVIPESFKSFNVKHNPLADVASIASSRGADKNPLLPDEMREYWKLIDIPGHEAALLRLHLLLGGQRVEQLVQLLNSNVQDDLVVLLDTKGRTGEVRQIVVPLIPAATQALKELQSSGNYAITVSPGRHLSPATARAWAKKAVGEKIENFELKRVRSGVATLLSKLKVVSEIRNHLQSHNLHGVEFKHYNMYDFFDEKTAALTIMHDFLSAKI